MMLAVFIFTIGSAVQAGAVNIAMLFIGSFDPQITAMKVTDIYREGYCWPCGRNAHHGHSALHFRGLIT